jgi:hypothetical protein
MHLTVTLGDFYKRNPQLVKTEFETLNLELARQKAKDTEEWKQQMKNNPEASNEMKQAAQEYAKENGYNENDYHETSPVIIEHYHYYPYPFWCGYPWWYEHYYWYPYPYWYHWGFYFWHGEIIWIGEPSWFFVHWHFHHHHYHHHFHKYPHLTNHYFNYYYGPRRSSSSNTNEVSGWVNGHRAEMPKDFLKNDAQRVDRIREYGKLDMNLEQQRKENPTIQIKRDDYIKEHSAEYPHLQAPKEEIAKPAEPVPPPLPTQEKQEEKATPQKKESPDYKYTPPAKTPATPKSQPKRPKPPVQVKPVPQKPTAPKPAPVPEKKRK